MCHQAVRGRVEGRGKVAVGCRAQWREKGGHGGLISAGMERHSGEKRVCI